MEMSLQPFKITHNLRRISQHLLRNMNFDLKFQVNYILNYNTFLNNYPGDPIGMFELNYIR